MTSLDFNYAQPYLDIQKTVSTIRQERKRERESVRKKERERKKMKETE